MKYRKAECERHQAASAHNPRRNAERRLYRAMRGKVRVRKGGVFSRAAWQNPKAKLFEATTL